MNVEFIHQQSYKMISYISLSLILVAVTFKIQTHFNSTNKNFNERFVFDRDARRSGPTIHFVGLETLVQNLL